MCMCMKRFILKITYDSYVFYFIFVNIRKGKVQACVIYLLINRGLNLLLDTKTNFVSIFRRYILCVCNLKFKSLLDYTKLNDLYHNSEFQTIFTLICRFSTNCNHWSFLSITWKPSPIKGQ